MSSDSHQREQALDLTHSVIVQAPAGSGKTELLCRRFLKALASVKHPSQVLAITFTRKAADEMRQRLLHYLRNPDQAPPQTALVLSQDKKCQWQLLEHPEQLNFLTIDGLCANIVEQSPFESGIYRYQVAESPTLLYQKAIQTLLQDIDKDYPWQNALRGLLLHFNNHWGNLQKLLIQMLEKREQWLSLLPEFSKPSEWRKQLEKNLAACLQEALEDVAQFFTPELQAELKALVEFANSTVSVCPSWQKLSTWPDAILENAPYWRELVNFLLTKEGTLRKSLDKRIGFPVGETSEKERNKAYKTRMLSVLEELALQADCEASLQRFMSAPERTYTEAEWQSVLQILTVLQTLLAYLHVIMQEEHQIDFTEVALRALVLLKQDQDVALRFDTQYQHILVDEFQDTSLLQYQLLTALTSHWQPGDGRSIFLVGDPLQSIYRFRQAEVGLFLRLWEQGFPHLPLTPLLLTQNFRAQKNLIDFYNEKLTQVLPPISHAQESAIAYTPLTATKDVTISPAFELITAAEEEYLAHFISKLQSLPSSATAAILVRSRHHLKKIIPVLQTHQIDFQARDLNKLIDQPIIIDLWSWLRALLNLEDRVAWLSVLHAPWLGISLNTLQLLFAEDKTLVWERLLRWKNSPLEQAQLNESEAQALVKFISLWSEALASRQMLPLDQILLMLWNELGASAYWFDTISNQASQRFWQLLQAFLQGQYLMDQKGFETALSQHSLDNSRLSKTCIEIMTMHKAKGLEFDFIFLPALEQTSQTDDLPLLLFDEVILTQGPTWILAPLHKPGQDHNKIFNFLWQLQKKKNHQEQLRLLYVALTRAKQAIYAYAEINDSDLSPKKGSLLAALVK